MSMVHEKIAYHLGDAKGPTRVAGLELQVILYLVLTTSDGVIHVRSTNLGQYELTGVAIQAPYR